MMMEGSVATKSLTPLPKREPSFLWIGGLGWVRQRRRHVHDSTRPSFLLPARPKKDPSFLYFEQARFCFPSCHAEHLGPMHTRRACANSNANPSMVLACSVTSHSHKQVLFAYVVCARPVWMRPQMSLCVALLRVDHQCRRCFRPDTRIPAVYSGMLNIPQSKAFDTFLNPTGWFKVSSFQLCMCVCDVYMCIVCVGVVGHNGRWHLFPEAQSKMDASMQTCRQFI